MAENVFEKIGTDIKDVAETIGKDIVQVVEFPEKLSKVLSTGETEYPVIKADYEALKAAAVSFVGAGATAGTADFANISADVAAISDFPTFLAAAKRFAADVETAYSEINADAS